MGVLNEMFRMGGVSASGLGVVVLYGLAVDGVLGFL